MVHTASVIGTEVPIWDIAARFDETDMLVRSMEQGRDLAATLGGNSCVDTAPWSRRARSSRP